MRVQETTQLVNYFEFLYCVASKSRINNVSGFYVPQCTGVRSFLVMSLVCPG